MAAITFDNADGKPYWDGARQGRLLLQRCPNCGHTQFPPRRLCVKCWSDDLTWIESGGRGTVESFTIVHRAPTSEFRANVPYVVASVLLAEGPRMITNLVGPSAPHVAIDDPVAVIFVTDSSGLMLPQFQLVPDQGTH